MLSQKNLQRRLQSSTRIELARDLHDSLAQDLVAIGFKLDLLLSDLPLRFRGAARDIRLDVTSATDKVRRELFALRDAESYYLEKLSNSAGKLELDIDGEITELRPELKRIIDELVRNAAVHSKGHKIKIAVTKHQITVSDDGQGMHGVSEMVDQLGGTMQITSTKFGTKVEIELP